MATSILSDEELSGVLEKIVSSPSRLGEIKDMADRRGQLAYLSRSGEVSFVSAGAAMMVGSGSGTDRELPADGYAWIPASASGMSPPAMAGLAGDEMGGLSSDGSSGESSQ